MTQIQPNTRYDGINSQDSFYAVCFKTTPSKKLFQQMFIEGGKKRPLGFLREVAFPLTLNNFGGVVERGVGRSHGGL